LSAGPNGAGKATIIRMLTGVLKPDIGSIKINGTDLEKELLSIKAKMGVIPEVGTVYLALTARENLDLLGRDYGLQKELREERAERLLKDLGLQDRANSLVKEFSKGMKQRIDIGCAIVHKPQVLLCVVAFLPLSLPMSALFTLPVLFFLGIFALQPWACFSPHLSIGHILMS
jgi:ABC-2 type transport system ATP-binding protein